MEYVDKRNGIVWTEEMFAECERLWDYFIKSLDNPFIILEAARVKDDIIPEYSKSYNAVGWLVANGYTVETFTVEYAGIPTEQVLLILLP